MFSSIEHLAKLAGDRADAMGCTFCTQIGEQPTLQETVESIRNLLQSGKEVDSEVFMGIASLALLGAFNAQGNKPIPIQ